ncbi:TauD/TfdA dioxygenase family protein [Acidisphaera rubrifaciens]|uniref:Alpha-ketoglutarate-dependent taurine dioxygenase n=1 Tax=Acidisphaera rubrifaciens HS-AP3 TaxID=1231350 RepID=A0A0D6P9A3_9PROT|nr:TauD/TfdA family dioxygenase [Acidisphaera rubrifaciens]GAN77778.1 alpha-ketoglutarate-dependent taurine dioxygenase [Acidisphaera rubrifaciens HS-AP3]
MSIEITPLHPLFVGEVAGADLRRALTAEEVRDIEAGMDRHAVLVFRDQMIDDEQQVAFTENFGAIEIAAGNQLKSQNESRRISVKLADISNLDGQNRMLARDDKRRMFNLGNQLWHSDSSFRAKPAKYSLLSARVVPPAGGNTEFADMRAAYDALDEATKAEVEDLVCEHSLLYSRGTLGFTDFTDDERQMFRPVRQRLVRTHPVTGRKSLFLSSHIGRIVGWPVPEGMAFIRDLIEHATQRQFVHAHVWRVGDLVMWDNRQTMHRARRYAETTHVRDMRRTTVAGEVHTAEQVAA